MRAPKCRICGKEEWSHLCKGAVPAVAVKKTIERMKAKPKKTARKKPVAA